jgi:SAM-dependent methyltransferase
VLNCVSIRMDLLEFEREPVSRHPWEVVRAEFFTALLERAFRARASPRVLDAGAGDAWYARRLAARFGGARVIAWDPAYSESVAEALGPAPANLEYARDRPRGPFDVVLLLDVLEHVVDDAALVRELVAELAPGGILLVSVPAWPALYTSHDVRLRHHRRYRPSTGASLLRTAGVEIAREGGLFHSLLIPRALEALAERAIGRAPGGAGVGAWRAPRIVSGAVTGALRVDAWLSRVETRFRLNVPGLSWWALCTKSLS